METSMESIAPEYETRQGAIKQDISKDTKTANIYDEIIKARTFKSEVSLKASKENVDSLRALQKIILYYENETLSLDEVLTRVLEFYREFTPY